MTLKIQLLILEYSKTGSEYSNLGLAFAVLEYSSYLWSTLK